MPSAANPAGPDHFDWGTAPTLAEFLKDIVPLTPDERDAIITQAKALLDGYYVHLLFKQDTHGVDPLGDLDRLRAALPPPNDDVGFHKAMCAIFANLRDLHTQYSLPRPYQGAAAILPFKLGAYVEAGRTRTIVTEVQETYAIPPDHGGFGVGAEILTWCGLPMEAAVTRLADQSGGASDPARRARALASMTLWPMERQPPPDETTVTLTYRAADARPAGELSEAWRVIATSLETTDPALALFVCLDHEGEARRHASKRAYHPRVVAAERNAANGGRHKPYADATLETTLPSVFRAHPIAGTEFGYIRIFTFNPPLPGAPFAVLRPAFKNEFIRLIGELPQQGLVVDVRGNGGGNVALAESLLQTLTANHIAPQRLEMRATPETLALCRASSDLHSFVPSLEQPVGASPGYSARFPLTPPEWCNDTGQQYSGPVVLIIDARCYSATDAFVAGFQDHAIGKIIGVSPTTGAGGANVWTLPLIQDALGIAPTETLPRGASLRVALRRTRRVGPSLGGLVEDFGVTANIQHTTTRADLQEADRDLLALAVRTLRG